MERFASWEGIFRRGACSTHLPFELRERLSLLDVSASNRIGHLRGVRDVFSVLNRGISIGIALAVAGDATLFGSSLSDETDEKGHGIPWPKLMTDKLNEAERLTRGRGRFHDHVVRVRDWLCSVQTPS